MTYIIRLFKAESGTIHRLIKSGSLPSVPKDSSLVFGSTLKNNHLKRRYISTEPNSADCTSVTNSYYRTPASEKVFSDISVMDSLSTREFRIFLNDVIGSKVDDIVLWSKAASYCINNASDFKFFDALSVLDCFTKARVYDKAVFTEFSKVLTMKSALMEPRHLVQCINVYASTGHFPESLFMEVFYGLIKQSEKMYANEFAETFLTLSKWKINNKQLLSALCKSLSKNVSILRYTNLTQIMACCRNLEVEDEPFYFILDSWQQKELNMMTVQEMLDALKKLAEMDVKWKYYEEELFKEFIKQTKLPHVIEQLADPFDCLEYLKKSQSVSKEFLYSLSKWCADAVHNPPSRSQKRPLTHQLLELYNLIEENNVESKYIDKAVLKFVTSKGGLRLRNPKPIPTVYKPGRKYIYREDPENPRIEPEIKFLEEDTEYKEREEQRLTK
ncbi:conserved hypothetical protein [Theileria orientalis strain Shintoku]|uniref:Uncharacterized protein n=1 Tax=Theileria orientalis strain Shintoku TaxID=869250 RepID=J4DAX8_THEOR|nr:conserved hypothetical protein [Theileria orientalis strain Shintoku]PVC51476.1 hypothetical protein MACL_00001551 [Theileria orientalis]BAM42245.1 conserved hypothetical protein [Theileria orientalis strain Shintoku]|eukprot:XP_009692546.1 conserved hypothetical protein [Theileria orientalis strain Shintoku]